MRETPFYFFGEGGGLFGILHEPNGLSMKPGVVMCHPFGEEKLWTHRVFVTFARALAREGYPVLRFDYRGNGDSDGRFADSSLETALADVKSAVGELRTKTTQADVILVGLRLGATIAALAAEKIDRVRQLVLWAPITDGARYMQELLRINLTTQMAVFKEIRQDREALTAELQRGGSVNVDGYEMTYPLFSEVSAVKLADGRKEFAGPCLIVQVDRAPGRPAQDLQQLASVYPDASVMFAQEEPFWKEIARFYDTAPNLFTVSLDWLKARSQA